jgi:hypothetical protein
MKKLIFVPIIHMSADLGSIANHVDKRGIAVFGEEFWKKHRETISGFWDSIVKYFSNLEVNDFKIYQDGMVADAEVGQKIVEEGVKSGSKNYEIIDDLLKKGAVLVKTEDFALVKEERDRIVKITQAATTTQKLIAYLKYKLAKNRLLKKRDNYIAKRIDETLDYGETGILLIGAYHDIIPKLAKDIQVIEVKEARKISRYQNLLLSARKNKLEFEELNKYLISPVTL